MIHKTVLYVTCIVILWCNICDALFIHAVFVLSDVESDQCRSDAVFVMKYHYLSVSEMQYFGATFIHILQLSLVRTTSYLWIKV